jgi:hypothetical protein
MLPMPGEVVPRSFVMSETAAAEEVPEMIPNLSVSRFAGPDGSVSADDEVAALEERIATEQASQHGHIASVHALPLGAPRAGFDVGSDQELVRIGMPAEGA